MKNKIEKIFSNSDFVLASSFIALIFYLLNWSWISWIFIIPLAFRLAQKVNESLRKLNKWFWWLVLLIAEFFSVLICSLGVRDINRFTTFLTDLYLLFFLSQIAEIIFRLFQRIFKKKKIKIPKTMLIIFGVFVFLLILIIHDQKIKRIVEVNLSETSSKPLERTIDCADEISEFYSNNDELIPELTEKTKQVKWNGNEYNLTIFNCPDKEKYTDDQVFALIKVNEDKSKNQILFTITDQIINEGNLEDINDDGLAELFVSGNNGGNCTNCSGYSIFRLVGDQVEDLLFDFPKAEGDKYSKVSGITDLNNDGIKEVLYYDDSFALSHNFLHFPVPVKTTIYSWVTNGYKDGSFHFYGFYINQISERNKKLQTLLNKQKNSPDITQQIAQIAVENYFDYVTVDEVAVGYDVFVRQTDYNSFPKTIEITDNDKAWLDEIRQEIERDYKELRPSKMLLY
jgi:hypothetical protein